jgi:hypothetical protein
MLNLRDTELHKIEQLKSDSLREIAKYLIKNESISFSVKHGRILLLIGFILTQYWILTD